MKNLDDQIWTFLKDDQFIVWVNEPGDDSMAYWEKWMKEHPDRVADLLKARQIARDLAYAESPVGAEALSEAIWAAIHADLETERKIISLPARTKRPARYWLAASMAGVLLTIGIYYYYRYSGNPDQPEHKIASILVKDDLQRTNQTIGNEVIYLVDGTKVILQPGSSIKHAVFLQKDKREVYLEGNAFFDVAKDPGRPFYVYAKDLVLRVLGTSFNVTTNSDNGDVTVVVKTGKVSVYEKTGRMQGLLILAPNQKALYRAQTRDLIQSDLDTRDLSLNAIPAGHPINFNFEEMPVIKIFKTLEDAYGIKVHCDEKVFSKCVVTTSLADETFEEKLKIICEAIGATYRIGNNEVFIEGKPCNE